MALKEMERTYTAEEFWELSHLPEYSDQRLVLIEGSIITMPPTGWIHGDTASELDMLIRQFVKRHSLGRVTAAETGYQLAAKTVLAPDVGFIAAQRVPDQLPSGYVPFAPDLAVEVISPSNHAAEIDAKVEKYLQYGTRAVWLVYPERHKITVYHAGELSSPTVQFLGIDATLDGGDVLPGFSIPLRDIFAQ
jgi:Uma2 family endonuclease